MIQLHSLGQCDSSNLSCTSFNNLINNNQMKKKMYIAASVCSLIAIHSMCNNYLMMGFTYLIVSLIFIIIGEYKSTKEINHEKEI